MPNIWEANSAWNEILLSTYTPKEMKKMFTVQQLAQLKDGKDVEIQTTERRLFRLATNDAKEPKWSVPLTTEVG